MRSYAAPLDQPLTRSLVTTWLGQRQHWFSRHVECPVSASGLTGVWLGRLAEPTPRTGAVRVTDWARWLSTHLQRPVAASAIMETGIRMTLAQLSNDAVMRTMTEVRSWRQSRMMIGPFKTPDSQDVFQVILTHEMIRRHADQ